MDEITRRRVNDLHARLLEATASYLAADANDHVTARRLLATVCAYYEALNGALLRTAFDGERMPQARVVIEPSKSKA